jgi:thiamine biosynthesis lipoprotein
MHPSSHSFEGTKIRLGAHRKHMVRSSEAGPAAPQDDGMDLRDDAPADRRTVHVEHVMGTAVSFDLRGGGDHDAAIAATAAWLHAVDARFSTYRPDSEVRRFAAGTLERLSPDLVEVVTACDVVAAESGGAFDAHRAGGFDPSAYVKGWSVERAARILRAHGCDRWSVNAGGDVLVASPAGATTPWRIGVQHPFDPAALATVLHATDLAVATSGRYERGDHITDPRTGDAATGCASTTVCGPDLGLADAFATAAFVLGEAGPAWVATLPGYECWTVLADGRVLATAGFPRLVHGTPVRTAPATHLLTEAA